MSSNTLSRGAHTLSIPFKLFAQNRQRLCKALKEKKVPANSLILLIGGHEHERYNTDANGCAFRQESFIFWTFGVQEPDFFGTLDVDSGKSTLYMPRLPAEYATWMGKIHGPDYYKKYYEVDDVIYADKLVDELSRKPPGNLLMLQGTNSDSGNTYVPEKIDGLDEKFGAIKDLNTLYPIISECRVFKSDLEIEVLRFVCKVSSDGHKAMMKAAKPGVFEYQLESVFKHHVYFNAGCREVGYTCIGATGPNASVLHYGHANEPNARQTKDGDMCLLDMGGEYFCYGADITCSFPVNGKFTPKQKIVYNAVYAANMAVMKAAKPGVMWADMHMLAETNILQHLKNAGLLKGEVKDMMAVRLAAVFMPHGLGHFLGLDVHDCGGYPAGTERLKGAGLKSLRTVRKLEPKMFITIEPGCYFIDHVLDAALANPDQAKFMIKEKIAEFRDFGGVRLEDDVLVTETGVENFSILPRTIEEVEAFMASK